jgi:serum/glucocorticoid-regulated kinase 2
VEAHQEYVLARVHRYAANVAAELKDTHLAPLANPFGRSSPQPPTPTPEVPRPPSATPTPLAQSTLTDAKDTTNIGMCAVQRPVPRRTDHPTAYSEAAAVASPPPLKPGILIITLHEGRGFSLPAEAEPKLTTNSQHVGSLSTGGGFSVVGSMRPNAARVPQVGSYAGGMRPSSAAGSMSAFPTNHGRYSSRYLPYALVDFDKQQIFINAVSGTPHDPVWAGENTQYKFDVSRPTDVTISLYIRNPMTAPNAGRNGDIFLGTYRISPRFEEVQQLVDDPKLSKKDREKAAALRKDQDKSQGQVGTEWMEVQHGTGSMKVGVHFVETRQHSLKIEDFDLLKVVGKGSFGKVMQVQKRDTHRIYALKTIRKAHIISRSEVAHTLAERSVLAQINNPFIVPLKFSFQSQEKLYFVLAFVNGGELFHHLQKEQRFDVNRARFYTAELLCALECLHGFNVIYRDLKPENILLDYTGHIALCDFGLCKLDMKDEDRTNSKFFIK